MTDHIDSLDDPSDRELAALEAVLAHAQAWEDPPPDLEHAVVAAIVAEADAWEAGPGAEVSTITSDLDARRGRRTWSPGSVLAAAAAVAIVVAGLVVTTRDGSDGVAFALTGTEAAPGATASVTISATPAGMKILLDAEGLDGAPDGYMYEAWVGDGDIGVSAGTFHLRGGDDPIELWAGVTGPEFRRLWVTLEPIDDDAASSGDTRLRGEFWLDDD